MEIKETAEKNVKFAAGVIPGGEKRRELCQDKPKFPEYGKR